jgi:hypothetical protein
VNKYGSQVLVLPEDDANRQIAEGFKLYPAVRLRNIVVLRVAGGWTAVRDSFTNEYNNRLRRSTNHLMVLLVDFDEKGEKRRDAVLEAVDEALRDRVFVLGARGEPEALRNKLGKNFEEIGKALAGDCHSSASTTWDDDLLAHNRPEIERMTKCGIQKILFDR